MDATHAGGPGGFLDKLQGFAAPAPAAVEFAQVKLVDESVAAQVFEAVSEGEDDIADGCRAVGHGSVKDQPRLAEGWFTQKVDESDTCAWFVVGMAVVGVVVAHQREE